MINLLKYHTFIPYEDSKRTVQLINLLDKIYLSGDPLHENYSLDKFDLDNQLAITFGTINDEIVLLSTLYKRPIYIPGIARTMNRVWKHEKLRAPTFGKYIKDSDITSLAIVPVHIQYALENNIDSIFISIEGGAHRYLNFLANKLSSVTNYKWYAPKEQIEVANGNHLQHVAYCHLNPGFSSQPSKQQEEFKII